MTHNPQHKPEQKPTTKGNENVRKGGLSKDELKKQNADDLPEREQMSLIDANIAAPVNAAVAANILAEDSTAEATAIQDADIDQSN